MIRCFCAWLFAFRLVRWHACLLVCAAEGAGDALSRPLAQKYRLFFSALAYSMSYREHRMLNPVALHVIQRLHSVIPRPHR